MKKLVIVLLLLGMPFIHGCGDNPFAQQLTDLKAEYESGRIDFFEYFYRWYEIIRNMVVYFCELFLKNIFKWCPWLPKINARENSILNIVANPFLNRIIRYY